MDISKSKRTMMVSTLTILTGIHLADNLSADNLIADNFLLLFKADNFLLLLRIL
tara:strand:+ start:190 stop:351 length:162 start_codon:yes stop_codon:yes gene_type:complete